MASKVAIAFFFVNVCIYRIYIFLKGRIFEVNLDAKNDLETCNV